MRVHACVCGFVGTMNKELTPLAAQWYQLVCGCMHACVRVRVLGYYEQTCQHLEQHNCLGSAPPALLCDLVGQGLIRLQTWKCM